MLYISICLPLKVILPFKCVATQTNIQRVNCEIDDSMYFRDDTLKAVPLYMKLKPEKQFLPGEITGAMIRDAGIARIQSQRRVDDTLYKLINNRSSIN